MWKILFMAVMIVDISSVYSQDHLSDNPITAPLVDYKVINSTDKAFHLKFDDGYKQPVKGPFSFIIRPDIRVRCPCSVYDFTFTDEKGIRVTRQITVGGSYSYINYSGADGKSYVVNGLSAINNVESGVDSRCVYTTDVSMVQLKTKPYATHYLKCENTGCLPEKVFICQAEIICNGHAEYGDYQGGATCPGDEEGCPDAEACLADPATNPFEEKISKERYRANPGKKQKVTGQ